MRLESKIKTFYALSLAWQLGFFIAVPIGGLLLLGLWGDKILGTSPLLLFGGAIIGMVVTAYGVYRLLFPLLKKPR